MMQLYAKKKNMMKLWLKKEQTLCDTEVYIKFMTSINLNYKFRSPQISVQSRFCHLVTVVLYTISNIH